MFNELKALKGVIDIKNHFLWKVFLLYCFGTFYCLLVIACYCVIVVSVVCDLPEQK